MGVLDGGGDRLREGVLVMDVNVGRFIVTNGYLDA